MDGYADTIVRINLESKEIRKEKVSEEMCKKYIGGYGFVTKILYDELTPGIDALSPENILIIANGPFPGTIVPTSSKYCVGAKSPLSNRIGFGISSGTIGVQMRRAGYLMLIITGKSPEPIYIFIDNGKISLVPCKDTLWGKTTWETEDEIRNTYSDQRIAVASIGQGGENLVRFACITNDRNRQVGRTGMGTVMGSKNLKALAFRGSQSVTIAQPTKFLLKAKEMIELSNMDAKTGKYRDLGTNINMMAFNEIGCLPTKNFSTGFFKNAEKISGFIMNEKYVTKKVACAQCPIACDHLAKTEKNHPDWPDVVSSVDYESLFALGSVCMVDDFNALIKAIELCDTYGIDTISGGVTIGWAMEAFEKGVITKAMLGDNPVYKNGLQWGDAKAMVQFVEDIALRATKAGSICANGTRLAAKELGKDSIKYAMQIKGVELPGYSLKSLKTASIGFSVSLRGGCHLRNGSYNFDIKGKVNRQVYDELDKRGAEIMKNDATMAVIDSLIICKFSRSLYENHADTAEVLNLVTGLGFTAEDVEMAGHRIIDLGKMFNLREIKAEGGIPIEDDYLPWRCYNEGNTDGSTKGWVCDKDGHINGLKAYYAARGWDENGIPTEATLNKRGLN
jgi:aldehyde:ferredoxin oxidoreductase